jgi:hypothetical protein
MSGCFEGVMEPHTIPRRSPALLNVWMQTAHNVFWGLSGVAIWVCFENVFAYLWASGRLPYIR